MPSWDRQSEGADTARPLTDAEKILEHKAAREAFRSKPENFDAVDPIARIDLDWYRSSKRAAELERAKPQQPAPPSEMPSPDDSTAERSLKQMLARARAEQAGREPGKDEPTENTAPGQSEREAQPEATDSTAVETAGTDEPGRLRDLARVFSGRSDDGSTQIEATDKPAAKTWLETDTRPAPLDATRVYNSDGYLDPPKPTEQQALDRSVPRDANGEPERFPNPIDRWTSEVNGDGKGTNPFRGNNCLDCSLSAISTWHGEPRVSAPRHVEYKPDGTRQDKTGEVDGPARAERWLGHAYEPMGADAAAYKAIARRLTDAGHGASAAIINAWPWGGAHAWNAFNHRGTVYWVDTQRANDQAASRPQYPNPGRISAIVMDSEGKKA